MKRDNPSERPNMIVRGSEDTRFKHALVECLIPLEVLANQIQRQPYRELSVDFQDTVRRAVSIGRAAIESEPNKK